MSTDIHKLKETMKNYLQKFKKMQPTIHQLGDGLQIRTQAANQTSAEGQAKFKFGFETVWLSIKHPNRNPINLAKMSEETNNTLSFEILLLGEHDDLVVKHFDKLVEIATP